MVPHTIAAVSETTTRRLPVVAGLAYIERIQRLPPRFTASLEPEPTNRFNARAVAVLAGGEKIGYLPPELAVHYCDMPPDRIPTECPARRASISAVEDTGVMVVLDASACPVPGDR
jgi:hypothetical protein